MGNYVIDICKYTKIDVSNLRIQDFMGNYVIDIYKYMKINVSNLRQVKRKVIILDNESNSLTNLYNQ